MGLQCTLRACFPGQTEAAPDSRGLLICSPVRQAGSLGSKSGVWIWVPLELQECALWLRVKIISNVGGDEGLGLGLGLCVGCGEGLSKQRKKVPPLGHRS